MNGAVREEERKLGAPPKLTEKESISTKPPKPPPSDRPPPQAPQPPPIDYAAPLTYPLPDDYAGSVLSRIIATTDGGLVFYGTDYVAVVRGHKVENVFDLGRLLHQKPGVVDAANHLDVLHAAVSGNALLVAAGRVERRPNSAARRTTSTRSTPRAVSSSGAAIRSSAARASRCRR